MADMRCGSPARGGAAACATGRCSPRPRLRRCGRSSIVAYAMLESPLWLVAGAAADMLRNGAWFAFLLALMDRSDKSGAEGGARDRVLMTVAATIVGGDSLAQLLIVGGTFVFGHPVRIAVYGTLAAAVLMLILVEQIFRNTVEASRWAIMPLCVGLAGTAVFDIYLFSDALLFNQLDLDIWSARGFVHALARAADHPFGVAPWRQRDARHRVAPGDVPLDRADRLRRLPAVHRRASATTSATSAANGAARCSCGAARRRAAAAAAVAVLRSDARQAAGAGRQALLQLPLRLPRRVAPLHGDAVGASARQPRWAPWSSAGWPTWSKVRRERSGCATRGAARFVPDRALERAGRGRPRTGRFVALAASCATPAGSSTWRGTVRRPHRYAASLLPPWLTAATPVLAGRPAPRRRRAARLRGAGAGANARRRQLGGHRPAQDGEPAGGGLPGPDAGHRSPARGAQVRRLQPDVGIRRPRPQEHRRPAEPDAAAMPSACTPIRSSSRT